MGAPNCVVGVRYAFEPVPTDVERDGQGNLWVSVLPGGPEDPSLGARGAVYKINKHGTVRRIHGGFVGATNLAVKEARSRRRAVRRQDLDAPQRQDRERAVDRRPVSVEATKIKLFVGQLAEFGPQVRAGPGSLNRFPR